MRLAGAPADTRIAKVVELLIVADGGLMLGSA
jgi:hypothetical protein